MNMTVRTIKTDAQTYSSSQKEQAQKCNVPIYLYPGAYAQRHGEIEEYRASRGCLTKKRQLLFGAKKAFGL